LTTTRVSLWFALRLRARQRSRILRRMVPLRDRRYLRVRFSLPRKRAEDRQRNPILRSLTRGPGCPRATAPTTRYRSISTAALAKVCRCAESTRSPRFSTTETPTTEPPLETLQG